MPGEHGNHVGDDEGGGRPCHQEEGDEGHSLQEAQHRAAGSALRSVGRDAGLLLAAPGGREPPRAGPPGGGHQADSYGLRDRSLRDGEGRPSPGGRGRAESREPRRLRTARQRAGLGGAPAARACCEMSEVTKRCPADLEERGDLPADASPGTRGRCSFRFWFGLRRGHRGRGARAGTPAFPSSGLRNSGRN